MTTLEPKNNFRGLWDSLRHGDSGLADIKVAGFILQHWFAKEPVGAASIGIPANAEFFALNSLVDVPGAFVILNTELSSPACRLRANEVTDLATREGYDCRFLIADLTLPERWAQLLTAVAFRRIGLLGLNGQWAVSNPKFWQHLGTFVHASKAVVYIRGALDYQEPHISIDLLRSIPIESQIKLIGATPSSLWFASADDAPALKEMLMSSQLFGWSTRRLQESTAIVARNDWIPDVVDCEGRFIRKRFTSASEVNDGLDFTAGWASPEPDGRWSSEPEAAAIIPLPSGVLQVRRLSITGNGWVPPDKPWQRIEFGIGLNPKSRAELQFANGNEIKSAVLQVLPTDILNRRIALTIKVRNPSRPSDFGEPDTRLLGFKFRALDLIT